MLKRKIDDYLIKWKKNDNRLPLIIYGARQIGKTTSIREFAKKNYKSVIEINFISNPECISFFSSFNIDDIINKISFYNPAFKFIPGETLIFFDEIQAFMDVTTSLKFFALDKRFDVICSGSALGINNLHISSVSVGYKAEYVMHSLDFEEYLWALGYTTTMIDLLKKHLFELVPLDKGILDVLFKHYDDYMTVGGMPKIVDNYIKTKLFDEVYLLQKELRKDYLDDIKQYVDGLDKAKVAKIYEMVPLQLAKDNHKFQFSKMGHGARFSSYFDCFNWLKDAGIINVLYNLNKLELPLKLEMQDNNFRVYFSDMGLFMAFLDKNSENILRTNRDFNIYKGALYESAILESLLKSGFENIFFYRSLDSTIELDFILEYFNNIIPIEVKSKSGRTKSLNKVLEENKEIKLAIKLAKTNIGYNDRILTIPYPLAFLIKEYLNKTL